MLFAGMAGGTEALTRGLALDLAPVRVNCVIPGKYLAIPAQGPVILMLLSSIWSSAASAAVILICTNLSIRMVPFALAP